jgi:hypothetical protein
MKSRVTQYMNEIVSITIMILMAVALIGSQMTVGAVVDQAAKRAEYVIVVAPGND